MRDEIFLLALRALDNFGSDEEAVANVSYSDTLKSELAHGWLAADQMSFSSCLNESLFNYFSISIVGRLWSHCLTPI